MSDVLEALTGAVLLLEALAAVWIVWRNYREVRFMGRLRPLMPKGADLPLFDALAARALQITVIGVYLLILTILGAAGVSVADAFPPIRAINGGLFLVLLAGPTYVGREMRRLASSSAGATAGDPS